MTTLRQELFKFAEELRAYGSLPRTNDDPEGDARYEVCKAHATRVEQILGHAEHEGLTLYMQDSDLCIYAVLPGGRSIRLADGVNSLETAGLSERDRAIVRTLLAVAQNELNSYRAEGVQQAYPVLPPPGMNGPF